MSEETKAYIVRSRNESATPLSIHGRAIHFPREQYSLHMGYIETSRHFFIMPYDSPESIIFGRLTYSSLCNFFDQADKTPDQVLKSEGISLQKLSQEQERNAKSIAERVRLEESIGKMLDLL